MNTTYQYLQVIRQREILPYHDPPAGVMHRFVKGPILKVAPVLADSHPGWSGNTHGSGAAHVHLFTQKYEIQPALFNVFQDKIK